jgi:protein-tyrosine phosphatase
MIDLHSHLLPAIDDGSRTVEQSVGVLERMAAEGVSDIALTPHLNASEIETRGGDALEERAEALRLLQPAAPHGVRLHLGFEIMLDRPMPPSVVNDRRYHLAGSRYALVEFHIGIVAAYTTRALEQLVASGVVPIVAHPERYRDCNPELVRQWRLKGAKTQVDATTLMREGVRGHRARELVRAGLADIVAADNHGDGKSLGAAVQYLRERAGGEVAELLGVVNPRAVLDDGEMKPVPPVRLWEGVMARLRRHLGW